MKIDLFDYQRKASVQCLQRLAKGRRGWADDGDLSSFALSAVTGAGKTVIATAVIEAMIHGSADLDTEPDPRAVFLWVTDDPALNRQTKLKMRDSSDLLDPNWLIELNDGFLDSELRPNRVYFLNVQQLAKGSGFSKGGNNFRQHSGWDILRNTIQAGDRDLYLILDEAHRGMGRNDQRPTIVQRIIGGEYGSNPPVPVVWGISATIDRFTTAMQAHEGKRDFFAPVKVETALVRASGIVKDQIDLDRPGETGDFHATLLRDAVDTTLEFEQRWRAYCEAEQETLVEPVLVVQIADTPSESHLAEVLGIIDSQWPGLGPHAVVNVFGEHQDLAISGRKVRYLNPESIQDDPLARVVLAKQAISTGWDCPRAEVLFSERVATDATHIAQIIGRMVRSPLAHRITTDDALNSVSCFLPKFNRDALDEITAALTRPGEPGDVADLVAHARLFDRNSAIETEVFDLIETLPSWPRPDELAHPLRRARALVKLLTDDSSGTALMPDAGAVLDALLNSKLDGLAAQHKIAVADNVANLEQADLARYSINIEGEALGASTRSVETSAADLSRYTRRVVNSLKEGTGRTYLAYRVNEAGDGADELAIRTEVAALVLVDGVAQEVGDAAEDWVNARLADFAAEIKLTTGQTRAAFDRVAESISYQARTGIELPTTLKSATRDSNAADANPLPTFSGHLFSDTDGTFPAKLNDWETPVIRAEIERSSFVAWYRNPSRATTSALRIGYHDGESWKSIQPDFIIVARRDDGTLVPSIVDPHGSHLADAMPKLRALADYADRFGSEFARIDAVSKGSGDALRVLDMEKPAVREAIREHGDQPATILFDSDHAHDFS